MTFIVSLVYKRHHLVRTQERTLGASIDPVSRVCVRCHQILWPVQVYETCNGHPCWSFVFTVSLCMITSPCVCLFVFLSILLVGETDLKWKEWDIPSRHLQRALRWHTISCRLMGHIWWPCRCGRWLCCSYGYVGSQEMAVATSFSLITSSFPEIINDFLWYRSLYLT